MKRAFLALVFFVAPANLEGEICRFRALDPENPFRRWLGSQEVTCVGAGTQLAFGSGLWNVFARAEGAISAAPLLIDGDRMPASVAPELGPAATVMPLLHEEHRGVIYVPRRGSAFPVDGARVTVPADEPLWLFVLYQSAPLAVVPVAPLAAGTERAVDGRHGGPAAVVGWLRVPETERSALATASSVTAPVVRAGSRDADPLPPPALLQGAFFRIRDVAPGNAEVRLEGRGWIPDRRMVDVEPGLTVAAAPLLVRPTGTLTVHWNTNDDLPSLERSLGSCEEIEAPRLTMTISKCAAARSGPRLEADECAPIREEKVEALAGSMTFDDVVPGLYRAEMRYGRLPPASGSATVAPMRVADLRVLGSYVTAYGSVTLGGEPLGEDAQIEFPTGIGFSPAEDDEYRLVLRRVLVEEETQITVEACDGSPRAIVLTDRPLRPHGRFDIDIPANELRLHVNDTFTREALPGATVKLEAMSVLRPSRVVYTTTAKANERGDVVWTHVPIRELHLRVTHAGYEPKRIEPFTMPESGTHTIDAQLLPLRGSRGRIVSDRPFAGAAVVWSSPAGLETERADLAEDGTFVYANRHTAEETMAVVSASHPLWVLRAPDTERREAISLRFPDAPAAAFDVWLATAVPSSEARHIGVVIGGVRVPQTVLAQHQTLRRDRSLLRGSGPQHFRDLLATGPIDVLLGPTDREMAGRPTNADPFALPQFDDARRRLGPGMTDVVFTLFSRER